MRLSLVYRQTVFPPARMRGDERTLDFTGDAPGFLHSWHRARTGEWYGPVSFPVRYASNLGEMRLENQLLPAKALRPRTYGVDRPSFNPPATPIEPAPSSITTGGTSACRARIAATRLRARPPSER